MGAQQSKSDDHLTAPKKRVAIIGGGAAGMAAAYSLARFPDKFTVSLYEGLPEVGGVASTCKIPGLPGEEEEEINDQVQGGAPSYRNNLLLLSEVGIKTTPVDFKIAFGNSPDSYWSNHGPPSDLVQRLAPEIAKFGRVLHTINHFEFIFAFVPIDKVMKWWGFSDEFCTRMVFPLTALFFGTGNQQPHVAAAVVARVFLDPQLRLFEYSPERLLDEVPLMFAYPKLRDIYQAMVDEMGAVVSFRTGAPVESVERIGNSTVKVYTATTTTTTEEYDDVIMCCGAEESLRLLGNGATFLEKRLLSNVRYYNDLIVTHTDEDYMARNYTFHPTEDMYFIRCDPKNPKIIEMSFNLAAYQPHLQGKRAVYQTIFLDDTLKEHWTVGDIDPSKILKERRTRQFAHTWTHFAFWVPFVSWLQGSKGCTWYAGAVTLMNTHEQATMSGLAAAERLGAPYPFGADALAAQQYSTYFTLAHGVIAKWRRSWSKELGDVSTKKAV